MNLSSLLAFKPIYRVTGTPENYLTALRFGIWGFHADKEAEWSKLKAGDIIYFHSTASKSRFLKKTPSCIVGFGVVGQDFFRDSSPLWIDEYDDPGISYPFKFRFSEIYLFADIKIDDSWDSVSLKKEEYTKIVIKELVEAGIPLSELSGFPAMGSFSSIQNEEVKKKLLAHPKKIYYYPYEEDELSADRAAEPADFVEIKLEERVRQAKSLLLFKDIQKKVNKSKSITYKVNPETRAIAEETHYSIVYHLHKALEQKGYTVVNNVHVDIFAYKGSHSILIEAKSLENNNFLAQTRKCIAQLQEYNYYECSKFKEDHQIKFLKEDLVLATSRIPQDKRYIGFVNSLNIKTIAVLDGKIENYGESVDFSNL